MYGCWVISAARVIIKERIQRLQVIVSYDHSCKHSWYLDWLMFSNTLKLLWDASMCDVLSDSTTLDTGCDLQEMKRTFWDPGAQQSEVAMASSPKFTIKKVCDLMTF
jgi:hypothetical protein